jgi:electron transfer flavoprotein beta subunit
MKVVVCIKQTPSTTAVLTVQNGAVSWSDPSGDKPNVLNPWDEFAVEEAIKLQEAHGGTAVALTAGPPESQEALKTCLAMGCGEAILLSDPALAGSDSRGTGKALAAAINKIGDVKMAFFGKQAIDGDTGQTPMQVARALGWTPLTFVAKIREIDPAAGTITVERLLEEGRQIVTAQLPVVVSVVKEINEPRYPSFMGIRKANRATIPTWSAGDLGVSPEPSKVDWAQVYAMPARAANTEMITGDSAQEQARILVDRLLEEKVL